MSDLHSFHCLGSFSQNTWVVYFSFPMPKIEDDPSLTDRLLLVGSNFVHCFQFTDGHSSNLEARPKLTTPRPLRSCLLHLSFAVLN